MALVNPDARTFAQPEPWQPSVLFPAGPESPAGHADWPRHHEPGRREPDFFGDLYLDKIVAALVKGTADYDLTAVYRSPLSDVDALGYRQEVFGDVDSGELGGVIRAFAARNLIHEARYRAQEIREDDHGIQHYYRERLLLNAVAEYCSTLTELDAGFRAHPPTSRGLSQFAEYLGDHLCSPEFRDLSEQTSRLENDFAAVTYVVAIRGDRLTVAACDDEPDYGQQVAATFARFQQRPSSVQASEFREWEAYAGTGVLDLIARLHPDLFAALDNFCEQHVQYVDPVIAAFDHDIRFYLAYLDFIAPLRSAGLHFSYPRLSSTDKTEQALDTFDLALARKLHAPPRTGAKGSSASPGPVVGNDITLHGTERILVISGPNNGGKTTLARTFGQLHYLARLGCPVPGRDTQLFVCDEIFTHFARAEDSTTMTGRLQTELDRLRDDFAVATSHSVIILNEVFNSTTAADALYLSRQILQRVTALEALCVCVTFLDELSTLNESVVSMVSTVVPDDPATRTHKVVRRRADGRAYAHAIAQKYGLGFDSLLVNLGDPDSSRVR